MKFQKLLRECLLVGLDLRFDRRLHQLVRLRGIGVRLGGHVGGAVGLGPVAVYVGVLGGGFKGLGQHLDRTLGIS